MAEVGASKDHSVRSRNDCEMSGKLKSEDDGTNISEKWPDEKSEESTCRTQQVKACSLCAVKLFLSQQRKQVHTHLNVCISIY